MSRSYSFFSLAELREQRHSLARRIANTKRVKKDTTQNAREQAARARELAELEDELRAIDAAIAVHWATRRLGRSVSTGARALWADVKQSFKDTFGD